MICLSHARVVVHSREGIAEVGKVLALGKVLYIVLHSQELKTVGHRLQPVAVDVVIGVGVVVLQHKMTEKPVVEEQRIEIVHRRFKILGKQCREVILLHIKGSSVLPAHHALTREDIRKLRVAVVPVLVKAKVEALYASYLPVEGAAYIHEFVEGPALSKLLVQRVEQVPVVVLFLDSGAFQLLCIEVAVHAAGAACAAYHLAPWRREQELALFQAAVYHVCRVLAYGLAVSLISSKERLVHEAVAHELIAHNGNVIGHLYAQLVKFVDQTVSHIVVGADHSLRQLQLPLVVALGKLLARVHPEVSEVYTLLVVLNAVLFQ